MVLHEVKLYESFFFAPPAPDRFGVALNNRAYLNGRVAYYDMETLDGAGYIANLDSQMENALSKFDYAYDGVLKNIIGIPPAAGPQVCVGYVGNAYKCNDLLDPDGSGDYIQFPSNANRQFDYSLEDCTVSFWYKPRTQSVERGVIGLTSPVGADLNNWAITAEGDQLRVRRVYYDMSSKRKTFSAYLPGGWNFGESDPLGLDVGYNGGWYYITVTFAHSSANVCRYRGYVDGILQQQTLMATNGGFAISDQYLTIGTFEYPVGTSYDSAEELIIDELQFFKRELTEDEVYRLYIGKTKEMSDVLGLRFNTSAENQPTPVVSYTFSSDTWMGSFQRPSSGMLRVLVREEDGTAVSGATVTATIYSPTDNSVWQTLTFTETSTAGAYIATFGLRSKDPLGTYPVAVSATKRVVDSSGNVRVSQTDFDGFITVYAGTPSMIRPFG